MKFYVAGPMSGIKSFNYPLFDEVADVLREMGHEVISPSEMDDAATRKEAMASVDGTIVDGKCNGDTWGDFLSRDVKLIADGEINAICLLPGWEKSRGARLEAFVALQLGYPMHEWEATCPSSGEDYFPVRVRSTWIMKRIEYGMANPLSNEEKRYGG